MRYHLLVVGVLLLVAAGFDIVVTVLAPGAGAGPISERVGRIAWALGLKVHRRRPEGRLLQAWGIGVVALTPLLWVVFLLLGWWAIFSVADGAVVETQTGRIAGAIDRFYYAGYAALSLGTGDFRPAGSIWQVATIVSTLSGLFLITLAVSYIIPVLSAATHRRRVARTIAGLGGTPAGIVIQCWDGRGVAALGTFASQLAGELELVGERHLTYPVLHYYHSVQPEAAFAPRLAALHDALLIILHGIAPDRVEDRTLVASLMRPIHVFLRTLQPHLIRPVEQPPPLPPLEHIEREKIPLDREGFYAAAEESSDVRRRLAGLVEYDGWDWTVAVELQREEDG